MSNNLDNLFKNALQGRRNEPPPRIWGNIERELAGRRRKRLLAWWSRGVAAMAVIGMALWFLQQETDGLVQMQWVNVAPPSIQTEESLRLLANANDYSNQDISKTGQQSDVATPVFTPYFPEAECLDFAVSCKSSSLVSSPIPDLSMKTQRIRTQIIPIVNGQALKNTQEYYKALEQETLKDKEKNKLKFFLSGHVAPIYSSGSYNSSSVNTRGYNYTKSQMRGMVNASGGLKLSVATGKRLSVQTGIFYSRIGQQTQENQTKASTAVFAFGNSSDYQYIVTPLGNLKNHAKAVSYRSDEAVALSRNNSQMEGIEQTFNTVEIPLALRYRLYEDKFSLSVSGGLSGNIVVDNKAYMIYSNNRKEYMGSTEDIRRFNLSTDLGIGIEYPLGQHVKVMLEPGFKYYVQSLSRNSQIDFKPYTFSLSTGIGIEF